MHAVRSELCISLLFADLCFFCMLSVRFAIGKGHVRNIKVNI